MQNSNKFFKVNIITPQRIEYSGEASSLIVPGELGYLGILTGHAPLMANLISGKIIIKDQANKLLVICSKGKGFLEILKNEVTLLLDRIERPAI